MENENEKTEEERVTKLKRRSEGGSFNPCKRLTFGFVSKIERFEKSLFGRLIMNSKLPL
jgi:hypothetical protein